jgi:hypothetical protein
MRQAGAGEGKNMDMSDELAYTSATERAAHLPARSFAGLGPRRLFPARIEARNPSIKAFVRFGFEDARQR